MFDFKRITLEDFSGIADVYHSAIWREELAALRGKVAKFEGMREPLSGSARSPFTRRINKYNARIEELRSILKDAPPVAMNPNKAIGEITGYYVRARQSAQDSIDEFLDDMCEKSVSGVMAWHGGDVVRAEYVVEQCDGALNFINDMPIGPSPADVFFAIVDGLVEQYQQDVQQYMSDSCNVRNSTSAMHNIVAESKVYAANSWLGLSGSGYRLNREIQLWCEKLWPAVEVWVEECEL